VRFAALLLAGTLCAQVAQQANERYQTPEGRANLARTLGSQDRDATQQPKAIVAMLEIKPGITVADIGTGAGYMLPYLSAAVGPSGRVIAEDIYPDFLKTAEHTAADQHLANVKFVLGTEKDAAIGPGVDLALMVDVYHHLNYPAVVLASIRGSLKQGGRLAVVEYHRRPDVMGGYAMQHIRLGVDDAIKEIESNGFKLVYRGEHEPAKQWVAIFAPQ
jgi:predicted methyltransferase